MYGNGRKTIGVFICEVSFHFQQNLCRHISRSAYGKGHNVAFFTSYPNQNENSDHDLGENNIVMLPKYEELDGVIIAPDTYTHSGHLLDSILQQVKERCTCPVVSMRGKLEGFHNVLVNDGEAIEDMVLHFIKKHGFTRLCFLSGPKSHPDGRERLQAFTRVMDENNLDYGEDDIYFGDFWRHSASRALNQFLAPGREKPQAIICANDFMALAVCQELVERGYLVPDDICVSGFDDVREASCNIPALTTVGASLQQMAQTAIQLIECEWSGQTERMDVYLSTDSHYRESCGCIPINRRSLTMNQTSLYRENEKLLTIHRSTRYLSIALESAKSVREVSSILDDMLYLNRNFQNFFMCLCMDEKDQRGSFTPRSDGYSKSMWATLVLMNRARTEEPDFVFDRDDLIPPQFVDNSPQIYYFSPLHYNQSSFGYVASNYTDHNTYGIAYQTILSHVSNTLQSVRVKEEMSRLVKELENLYIHDYLTGLYNRRGFERLANQYFNKSLETKDSLMVLIVDMDDLKYVNDLHGHLQGDLALQTIAQALRHACVSNEICARIGGDEFGVVGVNYDEDMMQRFVEQFYQFLDQYNSTSGKQYVVTASYGACITSHADDMGFEEYFNISDAAMYKYKSNKKLHFNITNLNFTRNKD